MNSNTEAKSVLVFGIPANYDKKEMYELLHLHEKQVKL